MSIFLLCCTRLFHGVCFHSCLSDNLTYSIALRPNLLASLQELGQTGKRRSLLYNLNNLRPSRGSLVGEKVLYDPEKLEHPPPWLHRISLSPFYCKHWDLCVHQSHTNQQTTEKGQFELKMVDFRPISRKGRIDAYRVRLRLIGGKIEKNP